MIRRLTRIELQGYKTFAANTNIEFGDVTCIVGPNGSGKSNIADGVRWVLGEQSFSLLRGRKTADMIFSGSEERSRASMASATIVFDNSDGWLPIDFAEVSLTRRAYRDGQNEYLMYSNRYQLPIFEYYEMRSNKAINRSFVIKNKDMDIDKRISIAKENSIAKRTLEKVKVLLRTASRIT